ncbi:hypothetical protein SAMN02949497_3739 [Methylomagnum ishizawai]|uniref:DUF1330 domain-containing protein n=1 Tax=Methylomagnum ishizawai TaxID=1760988 RepID=A0A1Y6D7T4_9GAMM|nr:DUF1330 domain-containing protein [Methylomagnum ishizawai]SMF96344.1 hypothetical protein SAMN02949497_3739 [Methylomagnum ishizawai]
MEKYFTEPTQESGAALFRRNISGTVMMLNLIRLKEIADYANSPELAPKTQISGREAFQKYIDHAMPFLKASGGELLLLGDGGKFLIGPSEEQWDIVMLVRQSSVESFFAFASNPGYMAGIGHRTAAVLDSRLLPVVERHIP